MQKCVDFCNSVTFNNTYKTYREVRLAAKTTNKKDLAIKCLLESFADGKPLSLKQAMMKGGYTERTAHGRCHELKNHPLYKKWQANQTKNAFSSKEALEKKLHTWLEADVRDYFDTKNGHITIKDLSLLTKDIANCIESIKETRHGIEIKLVSKVSAMDMLCKINGLFVTKHELTGEGGGPIMHYLGSDNLTKKVSDKLCKPNNRIEGYVN